MGDNLRVENLETWLDMFGSGLLMTCWGEGDIDWKRCSCRAFGLVGVGGYPSVDWLSVCTEGDWERGLSSGSIDTNEAKLAFRARLCLACLENRLPLFDGHGKGVVRLTPKGASEGDIGVPAAAWMFRMAAFAGLVISFGGGNIIVCFLQGVSGMCAFGSPASASLKFRFFLEIKPVDMNAAGRGLTVLKLAGVANEPCEENCEDWLSSCSCGRRAPMGNDFEKSCGRERSGRLGGS